MISMMWRLPWGHISHQPRYALLFSQRRRSTSESQQDSNRVPDTVGEASEAAQLRAKLEDAEAAAACRLAEKVRRIIPQPFICA